MISMDKNDPRLTATIQSLRAGQKMRITWTTDKGVRMTSTYTKPYTVFPSMTRKERDAVVAARKADRAAEKAAFKLAFGL